MGKKQSIFIASSVEGKKYLQAVQNEFFHDDFEIVPWYLLFTEPLEGNIECIEKLRDFDFAILILTPDDNIQSRGQNSPSPRDNLIFELGLLIGYIGRSRVFPLIPEKPIIKLPSDTIGTNPLLYHYSDKYTKIEEYQQAVSVACNIIRDKVENLGIRIPRIGENVKGYRSGIRLHDNIRFNEEEYRLEFRIGYCGDGHLLETHVTVHMDFILPAPPPYNRKRYWSTIDLALEYHPDIFLMSIFYHYFSDKSTIYRYLRDQMKFQKPRIESLDLHSIPHKIKVYVKGIDSETLTPQYNNKAYSFKDITSKEFKKFFDLDDSGEPNVESISWSDFNKLEP